MGCVWGRVIAILNQRSEGATPADIWRMFQAEGTVGAELWKQSAWYVDLFKEQQGGHLG